MRIDKFLWNLWILSRKDCKKEIKNWNIFLNWSPVEKEDIKINFWDKISFSWAEFIYKENIFLILNKPSWFVSSKIDEWWHISVYENILDCPYVWILEIVWRLDFDTTWLLLFTNNWKIIHKLINPKKNIFKKYYVKVKNKLSEKDIKKLESWVIIDWNYRTKKAKVEVLSDFEINLSIQEWKFHQIKKMLNSIWNEVTKLHRIEIWEIKLGNLNIWEWKYLDNDGVKYLENL